MQRVGEMRASKPGFNLNPILRVCTSDMLRPQNPLVEKAYYTHLKFLLAFTSWLFSSIESILHSHRNED
jgi:hypothetical protein